MRTRHRRATRKEGPPSAGGCAFSFDPDQNPLDAPALWHAEAASGVVTLDRAPAVFRDALPLRLDLAAVSDRSDGDGRHLVIDSGACRLRLWLRDVVPGTPLMVLLPLTASPQRAAAADAARLLFVGALPTAPAARVSPFQRQRLITLLRVLDGAQSGLTSREIGTRILYPRLDGIDAQAWKASSERRHVQRLVAEARHLMTVGYRQLLLA